jgi:cell division initiation protein
LKLNPLDIYNKEFKKSTFGYNTTQVDEFLDDVGVANNLQEENRDLREKIENYEDMEDKLQNTLDSMQGTISERVEQADNEARMIIKEARMKAEKNFFKIRFQTLLESHLEMLNEEAEESLRGDFDDSDFEVEGLEENNTDFEENR